MKYNRIFLIVCDSLGIGNACDSALYDDYGANTLKHICEKCNGLDVVNLEGLGLGNLGDFKGIHQLSLQLGYTLSLSEISNGKDTMTGHWEMMGLKTEKPFITFTDTGFPDEFIRLFEEKTGRKCVGNKAASGTEIIQEYGEHQIKTGDWIVYTSADSVLQLAANEAVVSVPELYHLCEVARELCMKEEYKVGRVIARPFIGTNKDNFTRTPRRHDYALSPSSYTYMETMKDHGYDVICVGKINDIFNGVGVTKTFKTVSNHNGMEITQEIAKEDFNGLCFVNLVEFDSEYGHRRNPLGYGKCIEEFDKDLGDLIKLLKDDDLLIVTADHGNDPTMPGSDHTREKVPFIAYSKSFKNGRRIDDRNSFADMGRTIIENFKLEKKDFQIGSIIDELLKD